MYEYKILKKFNHSVIKGYDIRGTFGKELTIEDVFIIGLAFGSWIDSNFSSNKKIAIGLDNRPSSEAIFETLSLALGQFDVEIYHIGLVSSPILSFATQKLNCCGMMITASHNNIQFNGMKISKPNSESLSGDEIEKIIQTFLMNEKYLDYNIESSVKNIKINQCDIFDDYIDFLFLNLYIRKESFFQKIRHKKIAFDFLGSSMERLTQNFFNTQENCFFVQNQKLMNNPDPTLPENLLNLRNLIKENECDCGFAFDGDCDRIVVLDENGDEIKVEHLGMILSIAIKDKKQEIRIVHDSRFSSKFKEFLKEKLHYQTHQSKIGHSVIKKAMKEFDANLSCETSGHFIFDDIGFDDGFYVALFLINNLASSIDLKLSAIVSSFPEIYCSENIKIYMKNQKIISHLENIIKKAEKQGKQIEYFDGIKILDENGWIFFRQSKTEECLTIKFEAYEKENFHKKELEVRDFLN